MPKPNLDHPTLPFLRERFADRGIVATEFRGQTTVVVRKEDLHGVLRFLRDDPRCGYNFLSDVAGIDYLNYPGQRTIPAGSPARGRFAVLYNLVSYSHNHRLFVKVHLDPTLDTYGIEHDPALHLPTATDLWPGAEWPEREVFDLFGIRFDGHPDLRRMFMPDDFAYHPQRKEFPTLGIPGSLPLPPQSTDGELTADPFARAHGDIPED